LILRFMVRCNWRKFRAKVEATLVSGSYSIRNSAFAGQLVVPAISMQTGHPGPGWEEIADPHFDESRITLVGIGSEPNTSTVIDALREEFGGRRLPDNDPVTHDDPASSSGG